MTPSPIGGSPAIANLHRLEDPTLSSVEGEDMDSRSQPGCAEKEPQLQASEPSAARARLLNLSHNLQALSAGFALGVVYGEFRYPEATLAGDLRAILNTGDPAKATGAKS